MSRFPCFLRQCLCFYAGLFLLPAGNVQASFSLESSGLISAFMSGWMLKFNKRHDSGERVPYFPEKDSIAVVALPPEQLQPGRWSEPKLLLVPYNSGASSVASNIQEQVESVTGCSRIFPVPSPAKGQPPTVYLSNTMSMTSIQVAGASPTPVPGSTASPLPNIPHSLIANTDNNQGNNLPPPNHSGAEESNSQDGEDEAVHPVILYYTDAGGDGDPEDPAGTNARLLDPDEQEKAFKALAEQVKKSRPWQVMSRWRIISKLIRFARQNRSYAARCYGLMERLIRWESLGVNILVKAAFNEALALSAFDDFWKASLRTGLVVTGDTMASLVPWFFPDKSWLEWLSLMFGTGLMTVTDNGFAHWTNSTYALPWLSNDFANYQMRLFFLFSANIWVSKYIYSGLLIGSATKITNPNLGYLLLADFMIKPAWLYLSVAVLVGAIPVFSVTCAPSPIGPYHFPFPNYCPDIPWIPWQGNCNGTGYSTEFGEEVNDQCPVAVTLPAESAGCNCSLKIELHKAPTEPPAEP